jgi:hypothetical protein
MKEYPSISRDLQYGIKIYGFDKLDGSNIRAEWSKKRSFYKFGTRHQLLGEDHPHLGEAISLVKGNWEKELSDIFTKQRYESVVTFFEFSGPNSFAGQHIQEPHKVNLIDVSPYKQGILGPDDFLNLFDHLDIAQLLFQGNFNHEVEQQIRKSELPGITFEGLVCKIKKEKKFEMPRMFKCKTYAWLDKLKNYCKDNETLYQKLL